MAILLVIFGSVIAVSGIIHQTYRRIITKTSLAETGTVTDLEEDGSGEYPVITMADGHEFRSKYGGSFNHKVGDKVTVLRKGDAFEIYPLTNRYLFTVIPLLAGISLLLLGLTTT